MININNDLTFDSLQPKIDRLWELSANKIHAIEASTDARGGKTPVSTVEGKYQPQGWTEWTQGFQFGSAILQFDATRDDAFLEIGRSKTVEVMASHVSHIGVHDHGFNNVSTYGNLWRLMNEGVLPENEFERNFYELALKITGAVQASRWTKTHDGTGFIHSFNGPQSLFVDTIRSCRALAVSHMLGHSLMGEQDESFNLLYRSIEHCTNTANYNIWYGEGRDNYDIRGRAAHETLWNVNNGVFRAPNTQQGYSPFSTWTRGLSWAMAGYPEQLEFLATLDDAEFEAIGGREKVEALYLKAAKATCDFFIEHTPVCGVTYWDTGAPNLHKLGDYLDRPADPYNDYEPVDSTAAAIGAQGLIRLGQYLEAKGETEEAKRYTQAGLTSLNTLLDEPYLSTDANHEGLLLHSIYHQPNGWDHVPAGQKIACGESSMWGDYHMRELALYVQRLGKGDAYYRFFGPTK